MQSDNGIKKGFLDSKKIQIHKQLLYSFKMYLFESEIINAFLNGG